MLPENFILQQLNEKVYNQSDFPIFNETTITNIIIAINYIEDENIDIEHYSNFLETLKNFDEWLDIHHHPNCVVAIADYDECIKEFINKH